MLREFKQWLRCLLCEQYIKPPDKKEKRNRKNIRDILFSQLPETKECSLFLLDHPYWVVDKAEMVRFLKKDKTNLFTYVEERYDCEDYTFRLLGNLSVPGWSDLAVFYVFGNHHAFSCFIDDEDMVWVIEPQTDRLIPPSELPKRYKPVWFIMK